MFGRNLEDCKYSVLMSVYHKENAKNFRIALDSIWNQTIPTDDFILVCDGPLSDSLNAVINEMEKIHRDDFKVVRLEKNGGLGNALNIGIKYSKHELVARMDSDDISRPDRCEKQLDVFKRYPEVSLVSGTVEEFTVSTNQIEAKRVLPEKQQNILDFSKKRNPFNHPCVMYKKSAVEDAGGYRDFYLLEDYYLWVRMLQKGYIGYNIQAPLLWMRAGSDMYKRRAGWKYAKSQQALFKYMLNTGYIKKRQYISSVVGRSIASLTPNWLREFLFKSLLREK